MESADNLFKDSDTYSLTYSDSDRLWILTSKISHYSWKFTSVDKIKEFMKTTTFEFHGYPSRRYFNNIIMDERYSD
jgi:hypothetical protein